MAVKYLLHFAHEHIPFRWPEFLALTSKNNCKFNLISSAEHLQTRPFILIELDDITHEEKLIKSVSESYLLKDLYELWAHSMMSVDDLALKASQSESFRKFKTLQVSEVNRTFRIDCKSFGTKITQTTKINMISKMLFLELTKSTLNLTNPRETYCIFQICREQASSYHGQDVDKIEYYFGRHLIKSSRQIVNKFSLKERNFIANTSMDPLLSLIAANTAQLKPNDLVLDPFVGSGSLLVAAAHMGAYVLGSDIDWLLLHGKSKPSRKGMTERAKGESVRANLRQYNLESKYLDVILSDISRHALDCQRFGLDAIIADPPYGVRESSERIGSRNGKVERIKDSSKIRFPAKISYHTSDLICDLIELSVLNLKIGGRLVYYLPVTFKTSDTRFEDFIPTHPSLELMYVCDQKLTSRTYRLMIVMEKKSEPKLGEREVTLPLALSSMNFRATYFNEVTKSHDNG